MCKLIPICRFNLVENYSWGQGVDARHTSKLKAKQNVFVVLSGILQILSYKQQVWFETPKMLEVTKWLQIMIY